MKYIIGTIMKFFTFIWDFILFFFGMPYERQCDKLKLDENDSMLRGPDNPKRNKIYFRANKVGKSDSIADTSVE